MPDLPLSPNDFLCLICAFSHSFDTWVVHSVSIRDPLKKWVLLELANLPVVQVFHVRDDVDLAVWPQQVCVVCQEGSVHDTLAMIALFEVRVREAKEELV